jgi:hypothetical protein
VTKVTLSSKARPNTLAVIFLFPVKEHPRMPKSVPISVRLDPEAFEAAQELARRSSRPLGSIVSELAREVIALYQSCGRDAAETLRRLEHVSPRQLEAALRYYQVHPAEIDSLIADNEQPVEVWERRYPHLAPLAG